jgi:hypothetical protein
MSDQKISTQRTLLPAPDVYTALRTSWLTLAGGTPTREQILCLMAQVWLETANGQAANNYALAGIKWTRGCGYDYAAYMTHEIINGQDVTLEQDFRAYRTLTDSAYDYLRLLRGQFVNCWPAIVAADVAEFAHQLHVRGWYTANEAGYVAGMQARRILLESQIPPDVAPFVGALPVVDNGDQPTPPDDVDPPEGTA